MKNWVLWQRGEELQRASGFTPLLASWEKKDHPAQVRLRRYVGDLMLAVGSLSSSAGKLYAHLSVDVESEDRLLHQYDLENYLTPLFGSERFPSSEFCLVSATKQVGGGSSLSIGLAEPMAPALAEDRWQHFSHETSVSTATGRWKHTIQDGLVRDHPTLMAPGPVEVHLAWRCSSRRNWVNLWKPTGDVLGPVLGESSVGDRFNPNDDRIVALSMHLNDAETMGYAVKVGAWWRAAD